MSASNPILCTTTRSEIDEIIHRGVICSTQIYSNGDNKIIFQAGDISKLFFPRSALKYVQILPLLETGAADNYGFTDLEIAVMCSSHNSEQVHLDTVRGILRKVVC
jgi:L-asparaginase II